jgi:hypothetical protein
MGPWFLFTDSQPNARETHDPVPFRSAGVSVLPTCSRPRTSRSSREAALCAVRVSVPCRRGATPCDRGLQPSGPGARSPASAVTACFWGSWGFRSGRVSSPALPPYITSPRPRRCFPRLGSFTSSPHHHPLPPASERSKEGESRCRSSSRR